MGCLFFIYILTEVIPGTSVVVLLEGGVQSRVDPNLKANRTAGKIAVIARAYSQGSRSWEQAFALVAADDGSAVCIIIGFDTRLRL